MTKQAISSPCQIDVKLRESESMGLVSEVFSKTPGLQSVVQLFPSDSDPQLRSLFMLEVDRDAIEEALHVLDTQPEIEYAQENGPRKLIR
ncbi:MAG: hypothetical protein NTX45_24985 [Proteobacteria bacterium]|nr:hypothetical protein [Pseudomonadota bacterium]